MPGALKIAFDWRNPQNAIRRDAPALCAPERGPLDLDDADRIYNEYLWNGEYAGPHRKKLRAEVESHMQVLLKTGGTAPPT